MCRPRVLLPSPSINSSKSYHTSLSVSARSALELGLFSFLRFDDWSRVFSAKTDPEGSRTEREPGQRFGEVGHPDWNEPNGTENVSSG